MAPPPQTANAATIARGAKLYYSSCFMCHGFFAEAGGPVPDLRLAPRPIWDQYDAIVRDGALKGAGMASFKDLFSKDDVAAIRAYVLQQAHLAWDQHKARPNAK